ncbi:MAG: ATP binding, partial [Watsoniomyces obsoletus]
MPPGAIRRLKSAAAAPGGTLTLRLGYRPPLDFPLLLSFLAKRSIPGIERVNADSYERVVGTADAAAWIRVSAIATRAHEQGSADDPADDLVTLEGRRLHLAVAVGEPMVHGRRMVALSDSPASSTRHAGLRAHRYAASPMELARRDPTTGYFSQPGSANSSSGRRPETPQLPSSSRSNHLRQNSSFDGLTPGGLPSNSPVIKIVHNGGQTKVINVKSCRTADAVTSMVLKKLLLPETHFRNYCFFVLIGLEPNANNCRRVTDNELMQICNDSMRSERNRLILRKINDGVPDMDDLRKAAKLAADESSVLHATALSSNNMRNQIKLQKLTGESWQHIQTPMSPVTTDRN